MIDFSIGRTTSAPYCCTLASYARSTSSKIFSRRPSSAMLSSASQHIAPRSLCGYVFVGRKPALGIHVHREVALDRLVQAFDVPHVFGTLRRHEAIDDGVHDFVTDAGHAAGDAST